MAMSDESAQSVTWGAAFPPHCLALRRILSLGVRALLALTVIAPEGVGA